MSGVIHNANTELDRIISLPMREPVNCEREPGTRRWAPTAQALVDIMTARYTRGPRLSCGCQSRQVILSSDGHLTVFRSGHPDMPPPLPLVTTVEKFCADNTHNPDTLKTVRALRPGQKADLPGLGINFCITELNPVQAWTLREIPLAEGAFGMISVGGGKTFIGILSVLAMPNCRTAILLAKPDQRVHYRLAYLRLREHFRVPSMIFDDDAMQGSYIVPGTPAVHFIPYSLLSGQKSADLFSRYMPDTVIADEWHLLSNRTAARTARFLNHLKKQNNVRLVGWSGSTVKKSMKDCAHLGAFSLGVKSPYPIPDHVVDQFSAVIDPSYTVDKYSETSDQIQAAFGAGATAKPYSEMAALMGDTTAVRNGFRERVVRSLGVISTVSSSVDCSITISKREPPPLPETILTALSSIRHGVRPDGEELVETVEIIVAARGAGAGYYNYWAYVRGEPRELIDEWFEKRKAWNKELRRKILQGEPYLDSRGLCENAAERAARVPRYSGPLPVWPADSWSAWAEIKDRVQPDPRTRWIDDFLVKDAAVWALEKPGIVWTQSIAFGKAIAKQAGIRYHGGGANAESLILAEDGKQSIVASIDSHGVGRDGLQQRFSRQLVAEPPASSDRWEQLLGRTARIGQTADTVETFIYLHTAENRDAFAKALMLAEYIEATTPNKQLLLSADIDFEV